WSGVPTAHTVDTTPESQFDWKLGCWIGPPLPPPLPVSSIPSVETPLNHGYEDRRIQASKRRSLQDSLSRDEFKYLREHYVLTTGLSVGMIYQWRNAK